MLCDKPVLLQTVTSIFQILFSPLIKSMLPTKRRIQRISERQCLLFMYIILSSAAPPFGFWNRFTLNIECHLNSSELFLGDDTISDPLTFYLTGFFYSESTILALGRFLATHFLYGLVLELLLVNNFGQIIILFSVHCFGVGICGQCHVRSPTL